MALPREQRLKLPLTGERLLRRAKVSPLEVRVYQSDQNKAAVVVPKMHIKKAFKRNLIKRQCLAVIQQQFKEKHLGIIYVRVYAKPDQENMAAVMHKCFELLRR